MNMNNIVVVTLTELGVGVYNNRIVELDLGKYCKEVEVGHTLRTELWSLFSIFGEHVGLGKDMPFLCGEITLAEEK